jgi:hypothetical protein
MAAESVAVTERSSSTGKVLQAVEGVAHLVTSRFFKEIIMKVKDKSGRQIEISVYGRYEDDIQIDEAYYTDSEEEVSDETLDYIYSQYADAMYEEWYDNKVGEAEYYYEGDR